MRRREFIVLFGSAASWPHAVGAQRAEPLPGPGAALARRTFALGGASLAIFLPETAVMKDLAGGNVIFDLAKGGRLQRTLSLAKAPFEAGVGNGRILANGARLEYAVHYGSGGNRRTDRPFANWLAGPFGYVHGPG